MLKHLGLRDYGELALIMVTMLVVVFAAAAWIGG